MASARPARPVPPWLMVAPACGRLDPSPAAGDVSARLGGIPYVSQVTAALTAWATASASRTSESWGPASLGVILVVPEWRTGCVHGRPCVCATAITGVCSLFSREYRAMGVVEPQVR